MLHLYILTLMIGLAYSVCPTGRFQFNGICVPPSHSICPSNSIYINGVCKYRSDYLCNTGNVYSSGVCARFSPDTACMQTPLKCIQPSSCNSNDYNECPFGQVCPQNLILYGGRCVTQSIAQCPTRTKLQSGHCVRPNPCPAGSVYQQGSCKPVSSIAIKYPCPVNSHKVDGVCVQDNNVACPIGSSFVNGKCIRDEPCMPGTFEQNGVCAQCPINSTYINGNCVHCLAGMILKNGRCVCKPGQVLLRDECVYLKNVMCSGNDIYSDGKCILPYCYGNRCCLDSICNLCFAKCEKDHKDTSSLSNCQSECFENKPELKTKLNTTNLVNSTNIHNITTNSNNVNVEDDSQSTITKNGIKNHTISIESENEEKCCVIFGPKRCIPVYGKYKCYQIRKHTCGEECLGKVISLQTPFYPPPVKPRLMYRQPQQPYQFMQQPLLVQQPQMIKEAQQTSKQNPPVYPQRTQLLLQQPQIIPQQPQVIQQPRVIQQPKTFQQPYYAYAYQQPQAYSQPQYQFLTQQMYQQPQMFSMMQPQMQGLKQQTIQKPSAILQPQYQTIQPTSAKISGRPVCTYQREWPYYKCSQ